MATNKIQSKLDVQWCSIARWNPEALRWEENTTTKFDNKKFDKHQIWQSHTQQHDGFWQFAYWILNQQSCNANSSIWVKLNGLHCGAERKIASYCWLRQERVTSMAMYCIMVPTTTLMHPSLQHQSGTGKICRDWEKLPCVSLREAPPFPFLGQETLFWIPISEAEVATKLL